MCADVSHKHKSTRPGCCQHLTWPLLLFSLVAVSVVVFVGTGPKYLGSLDAGLCIQKCRAIILVSGGA